MCTCSCSQHWCLVVAAAAPCSFAGKGEGGRDPGRPLLLLQLFYCQQRPAAGAGAGARARLIGRAALGLQSRRPPSHPIACLLSEPEGGRERLLRLLQRSG